MNIVIITGSAHEHGTSACLADNFIRGAKEEGHSVYRFDAAINNIHPCIGCDKCRNDNNGCIFNDDMDTLNPYILKADAIVFISPIYYFDFTAQIKAVIDRFYANNAALRSKKKTACILTSGDSGWEVTAGAIATYMTMVNYLGWENSGTIMASGCYKLENIINTGFPDKAYELGKSI